jgi:hypothetical protein
METFWRIKMIDKNTGHIIISDEVVIKHNDLREGILSLNIGQRGEESNHNNGWSWIWERNAFIDNKYFIFHFAFFENRLKEIHFLVNDTKFELTNSWETWSEKKELEKLEQYKKWLTNELGTQKEFEWGTVWAAYDPNGGSSSIGIRYK